MNECLEKRSRKGSKVHECLESLEKIYDWGIKTFVFAEIYV